jgi:hypothetical protein
MPWGIALKVEAAVLVRLLEKAHLLGEPKEPVVGMGAP